ncbi:MAG: dTDP-glucose 4,6-dehydratase [Gloeobacteraceae cyanobacterium ES-bin-144]|nr:dTDP-glucose 4,6-dehydratase [Verrucomicrobiales bacterium]
MRILVTGGAGFIGCNLVSYLLGETVSEFGIQIDRVVTLDKLTYAGSRANLAAVEKDSRHVFVQGDIGDPLLVGSLLREHRIDSVVHLAAESHVDHSIANPENFVMTNIVGTYRLLEAFRCYLMELATAEGRFLHVSTDEVFGSLKAEAVAFCETTPYAPNSPYSASKAGSDHIARAYHETYGLPVITTNCSNNYGPYQFPEKLIPLALRKILRNEPIPVYGNGTHVRDWLYVDDHCRGMVAALVCGTPGRTYVIGGECEMRNIDLVHAIIETVRELAPEKVTKPIEQMIAFVNDRPGHDFRYAINPMRIKSELGWTARESFPSGIRKTVQWYLDHQDWIAGSLSPLREVST